MQALRWRWLFASAGLAATLLAGCATRGTSALPDVPWHDETFAWDSRLVTVTAESLFALDPQTLGAVHDREAALESRAQGRTSELLELVFGPEMKAFAYAGGHSTVAAETWSNRRGDCLSLSILTVALARELGVPAQIQEVRVPPLFDRRGGVDFVNRHVNVLVRNDREIWAFGRTLRPGPMVVDFEPQVGSRSRGHRLDQAQVLARFLNNLGGESLAAGDLPRAYAHFRSAIEADPGYGPGYANLAQLYLRRDLKTDAERLLRTAVARDDAPYTAMVSLQRLLDSSGRAEEASRLEAELRARRDEDPYYWFGLGIDRLQKARLDEAIDALERAQSMTSGFDEIHQALAIAYWRTGQVHMARDQLARLGGSGSAKLAILQRKLGEPSAGGAAPSR